MTYKNYFIKKNKKYRAKNGNVAASILIIAFTINKLVCYLLINFISKKSKTSRLSNKSILFIEPTHQGFGDLLFQSPLFKSWSESEYIVNVLLAKKQHGDILKNNPYVSEIFTWSVEDLSKILFRRYGNIFGLCRNSIRENILLAAKISSNKILPDSDLALWEKSFSANPNTIAWQVMVNKINPALYAKGVPQVFFSESEKKYIAANKKGQIEIIAGTEDKSKRVPALTNLLSWIPATLYNRIVLIGKGTNKKMVHSPIINLISKLTYRETILEIASAKTVIGPEGSLVHIAAAIGAQTVVYDPGGIFIKNTHPSLLKKDNLFIARNDQELKDAIGSLCPSSAGN